MYFVLAYPQKVVIVKSGEKISKRSSWVTSSLIEEGTKAFMPFKEVRTLMNAPNSSTSTAMIIPKKQVLMCIELSKVITPHL